MIDEMVVELQRQKANDIQHKDFCISERHINDVHQQDNAEAQEDLVESISSVNQTIADTKAVIGELVGEIKDLTDSKNQAIADREAENKQFRLELQDQDEARRILKQ